MPGHLASAPLAGAPPLTTPDCRGHVADSMSTEHHAPDSFKLFAWPILATPASKRQSYPVARGRFRIPSAVTCGYKVA